MKADVHETYILLLAGVALKESWILLAFLSCYISVTLLLRPPPPPSQHSIISHDRWALRSCQNSPAPKIPIPVFAPPSSLIHLLSFPPLIMHACSLAEGVRQGRGSPTPPQLPAILLFWGGSFLIFLPVVFILALAIVTDPAPAPPLRLVAARTAGPQHHRKEIERRLSWKSGYFFLLLFSLRAPFFSSCINFWFTGMNLESTFCGRFKTAPLFSFIPPLIPRLRPALQWTASLHVCISRPSRMRIRAAACSCHNPVGCPR